MIKFLDLKGINARYKKEFKEAFDVFLESGNYVLGQGVLDFEDSFSKYCNTKYCVGVSNGLDALILIFKAYIQLGKLKKGDEIIVPANTYIASILSILEVDLKPVFVEPNIHTFNCEASEIEKHVTNKTKAILIVHLYGQLAKTKPIKQLAKNNGLLLIEDAAQAQGAVSVDNDNAGNIGNAAGFSFYPTKNLGALGEAGAVTTNDQALARVVKELRNYGTSGKYNNVRIGINNRIDELQALFLKVKLKGLNEDNRSRKNIAKRYLSEINNKKIKLPYYDGSNNHVFHQFIILVECREQFINYLLEHGVQTAIHYPTPPHKQKALAAFSELSLPITEQIHKTCVSVPINPVLTDLEVSKIIKAINNF